jgi:hypothetical protein
MNFPGFILFLLSIGSLVYSCVQPESSNQEEIRTAVQDVLNEQLIAWNEGDIEGFMQGYWNSEHLRFSSKQGTTYGYDKVLQSYKKSFPDRDDMGKLYFGIDSIYLDRLPFVMVEGAWTIHRYDTAGGRFVLTFSEVENGSWKIIEDHTW